MVMANTDGVAIATTGRMVELRKCVATESVTTCKAHYGKSASEKTP